MFCHLLRHYIRHYFDVIFFIFFYADAPMPPFAEPPPRHAYAYAATAADGFHYCRDLRHADAIDG